MKKILSIAFVAAFLAASIGCDDKKSTPAKTGTGTSAPGAPSATTTK